MTKDAIVWALERAADILDELGQRYSDDRPDALRRQGFWDAAAEVRSLISTLPAEWEQRKAAAMQASADPARQSQPTTAIEPAPAAAPAHTDHPLRHWDRTCPACLAKPAGGMPEEPLSVMAWRNEPEGTGAHKAVVYIDALRTRAEQAEARLREALAAVRDAEQWLNAWTDYREKHTAIIAFAARGGAAPATVLWGPEKQNYPNGPVYRKGVSNGATAPAPEPAGGMPCVYQSGCAYLAHGDCKRERKCLGGWPFNSAAPDAGGMPEEEDDSRYPYDADDLRIYVKELKAHVMELEERVREYARANIGALDRAEQLQERVRELEQSVLDMSHPNIKSFLEASKLKDDLIALNFNLAEQAEARLWEAEKDAERYLLAFSHHHVNNGVSDACKVCGLDLRDKIHATSSLEAARERKILLIAALAAQGEEKDGG